MFNTCNTGLQRAIYDTVYSPWVIIHSNNPCFLRYQVQSKMSENPCCLHSQKLQYKMESIYTKEIDVFKT